MIELPELLTPADVADWLNMPRAKVIALASRGEIPSLRIADGEFRFDFDMLRTWLDTRPRQPVQTGGMV